MGFHRADRKDEMSDILYKEIKNESEGRKVKVSRERERSTTVGCIRHSASLCPFIFSWAPFSVFLTRLLLLLVFIPALFCVASLSLSSLYPDEKQILQQEK